jgi:hypothetical protein
MSWNGAGNFNRLYSWVADKAAGLNISSARIDADSNDIAAKWFRELLDAGWARATNRKPADGKFSPHRGRQRRRAQ